MKLYFAWTGRNPDNYKTIVERILIAYPNKNIVKLKDKKDIFVDSGAFSVFNKTKKIIHSEYIDFLKENNLKTYASLDVIGNGDSSYNNFMIEKKEGLNSIPCYHEGDDIDYLKKYIENSNYIGLGGMVKTNKDRLRKFLDSCFSIRYKMGSDCKFHGYGLNSKELLAMYPFYSVDATTWYVGFLYKEICSDKISEGRIKRKDVISRGNKDDIFAVMNGGEGYHNMNRFLELEKYITELWKRKGVVWND
jgi:hypothetical protein